MKKIQFVVSVLMMAALLLVGAPKNVAAQKFASYQSGTQIFNLEAADANVELQYYVLSGEAGATTPVTASKVVPANNSITVFPVQDGVADGFVGSLVIMSDKMTAAVSNVQNGDATASAAYVGASMGSTTVSLPLLMKENGRVPYSTWFSVQNAGAADANVTVDYTDAGCPGASDATAVIQPNTSKQFMQQTAACVTGKVFSGTVTSDQPVVVVVMEENVEKMLAYTGFAAGSTSLVFPLINTNNSGISTGIQIQNTSAAASDVTVTYTPSLAGTACTEMQTVPANGSATFALSTFTGGSLPVGITTTCVRGERFVGSARVTANSTSAPLVAIVNQTKTTYGEAYGAFDPMGATAKIVMPLLMDRNGRNSYSTGFSVMNTSLTDTIYVKCMISGTGAEVDAFNASAAMKGMLAPGSALTPNMSGQVKVAYVGSGTCMSYSDAGYTTLKNDAMIVGVVNEIGRTDKDRLLVYEAVNVAQ